MVTNCFAQKNIEISFYPIFDPRSGQDTEPGNAYAVLYSMQVIWICDLAQSPAAKSQKQIVSR